MNNPYSDYHALWEKNLRQVDPNVADLIDEEKQRQARKLIFIPSESFCIQPVRESLSSTFTNIYAEGYPAADMIRETEEQLSDLPRQLAEYRRNADRRFYKGTEYVNVLETITQKRVAKALENERAAAEDLHVNVQPLSGANANNAIYEAFVPPGETVMGMDLAHGGHLSHGSPFNRTGKRWDIVSYRVEEDTEKLNYNRIMEKAREHEPEMIIAGFTSYPWAPDWKKFREIADACGALLLADIAHTAGLVMGDAHPSPIGIADVVNFTTHKTAFGPRGAVSVTTDPDLASKIRYSVFPGEQGGPHTNKFAAMATAFKIAQSDTYRRIQQDTVKNAQALAEALDNEGIRIPYGGTNTHLLLMDVCAAHPEAEWELWGEPVVRIMDLVGLVANKNTIPGDKTAADARGVRLGTPWLTQRGLDERDMETIAELIARLVHNLQPVQYDTGRKTTPHAQVELDVLREIAKGVKTLTKKAYAEGKSDEHDETYEYGYPLDVYLDEPVEKPGPLSVETGHLSLSESETETVHDRTTELDPPEPGEGKEQEINEAREGAVAIHRGRRSVIDVHDWKATALLQEATSRNIRSLSDGEGHRCHLYDGDGRLIEEIDLYRLGSNRFHLLTSVERFQDVLSWIRGLSDGYTVFDQEDPKRKVRGPAVVQNLHQTESLTALDVIGSKALEIIRERYPDARSLDAGETIPLDDQEIGIRRIFFHDRNPFPHLTLLVAEEASVDVWNELTGAGASPAGQQAYRALLDEFVRVTPARKRLQADEAFEQNGNRTVDLEKPYFIGQQELESERNVDVDEKSEHSWDEPDEIRKTELYDTHRELGAKMTEFGGWSMPVQYRGILEEHRAVRNNAGLFDVGHMGILQVSGRDTVPFLDLLTTNDVYNLEDGEAQYSFLLTPGADVMDDLLLYRRSSTNFFLVVNAGNQDCVRSWLESVNVGTVCMDHNRPHIACPVTVEIRDLKTPEGDQEGRLDLALQGPESFSILSDWIDDDELINCIHRMERFEFLQAGIQGHDVILSRTGYTGEEMGYELYVHPDEATSIWNELLEVGEPHGIEPAGLGARDTLRIEAGLPLHGHDLDGEREISPFGAGYGGFVKWYKTYFIGRDTLKQKEEDRTQTVIRFKTEPDGRPVREGDAVMDPERGTCIGEVTSALVRRGEQIGLAYVNSDYRNTDTELGIISSRNLNRDEFRVGDSLENHRSNARSARVLSRFMKGEPPLDW